MEGASDARLWIVGAACACAGLGVGWFARSAPTAAHEVAPSRDVAATTEVPAPCPPCPTAAAGSDCPAEDAGESLVVEAQQAQIEGLSDAAFGVPLRWSEPAAAAAAQATVEEVLRDCPHIRRFDVDCSEPPCLLSIGVDGQGFAQARQQCRGWGRLRVDAYTEVARDCPSGRSTFLVLSAAIGAYDADVPDAPPDNRRRRRDSRSEGLRELWTCE